MDLLHPRFILDAANPPRRRIAFNRLREKLHLAVARLTAKPPAACLVLIGRPGIGKITLADQIILIEAAEPRPQQNHTTQSILNFISKSAHCTGQWLQSSGRSALIAAAQLWN